LILVLYSAWQYAGAWSIGRRRAATTRAEWIWRAERALHLPSERSVQSLIIGDHWLVRALNIFYASVHVPAMGTCMVWLFVRHRDRYPPVRMVIALVTGASLVIQMFPVAPPRLVPSFGVVDTAARFGPSVYAKGAPGIDQLAALPSLHVGWAVVVAGSIVWVGRSRWRWLAIAYPAVTILTVVATGNHYWADAIVAVALCAISATIAWLAYRKGRSPSGQGQVEGYDESVAATSGEIADQSGSPVRGMGLGQGAPTSSLTSPMCDDLV
jgi:hypothetical protein